MPSLTPSAGPVAGGACGRVAGEPATSVAGPAVRLTDVTKVYGQGTRAVLALDKVSLSVKSGEFTCIIGASGCGKSTLLNLVAGLDQVSSGDLATTGQVTLMFQEPALFPWLSASKNVELALRARGVAKAERRARALELLEAVHHQPHRDPGALVAREQAHTEGARAMQR